MFGDFFIKIFLYCFYVGIWWEEFIRIKSKFRFKENDVYWY